MRKMQASTSKMSAVIPEHGINTLGVSSLRIHSATEKVLEQHERAYFRLQALPLSFCPYHLYKQTFNGVQVRQTSKWVQSVPSYVVRVSDRHADNAPLYVSR
jgi:hypothetical protein